MLRKLSASFFLTVMALVIGLHSPVLGYCGTADEIFLVDHVHHHDCDHDDEPAEVPCPHGHDFVTLDPGDFQWNPLGLLTPPIAMVPADFESTPMVFISEPVVPVSLINVIDPPPPDMPIFRRDAALRL